MASDATTRTCPGRAATTAPGLFFLLFVNNGANGGIDGNGRNGKIVAHQQENAMPASFPHLHNTPDADKFGPYQLRSMVERNNCVIDIFGDELGYCIDAPDTITTHVQVARDGYTFGKLTFMFQIFSRGNQ